MSQETNKLIKRESNFELLRIISMLLIVFHHYSLHGGLVQLKTPNLLVAHILASGGKIGVDLFIIISAYFMANNKCSFKRLLKLILEVYFYSILMMFVTYFFTKKMTYNMIKDSLLIPIFNQYWFVKIYIFIYVFSQILNLIISKMNVIIHKLLLIVSFVFLYVIQPIYLKQDPNQYILFIFLYCLGAYIKIYNVNFKYKFDKIFLIIWMYILTIYIGYNGLMGYIYADSSFSLLIISALLFILLKDTKIEYNKIINKIASLCFPVYLIHDNEYFRSVFWKNIIHCEKFYYANSFVLLGNVAFSVILLYFCAYVIELFRKYIENLFFENKKEEEKIKICT